MRWMLLCALLPAGCAQIESWQVGAQDAMDKVDRDGDGWSSAGGDCNEDCDAFLVSPGGSTVCYGWYFHPMDAGRLSELSIADGLDQDCDGVTDDDQPGIDRDGDQYAQIPEGDEPADCDDRNTRVHPGARELCGDGLDQDCDGEDAACGEA